MKEAIEQHQRGEESQSAALRRILRWGLDRADPERDRRPLALGALVAGATYVALYLLNLRSAIIPLAGIYIIVTAAWAAAPRWRTWLG
jgi:hypothetical protein